MAIVFCGMILSRYGLVNLSKSANKIVIKLSTTLSQLFEDIAFLIIGLSVFGLTHKWEKIDTFVVVQNFLFLFISRFLSVMIVTWIVIILKIKHIGTNFQTILFCAGIRGAMCNFTSLCPGNRKSFAFPWGGIPDADHFDDRPVDLYLRNSDAVFGEIFPGEQTVG